MAGLCLLDDMFGLTIKFGSKFWILGRDTNRASVEVTLSHHYASERNKRSSSKAPLFRAKQTSNSNIPTSTDLTISLHNNTTTQIIEDECLVSLSKTKLPRETGVLDTSPAGSTSTTIVTRNQNVIGPGLSDTGSDDTDTSLGDELDGDTRAGVGALQVVDELLQILNRVNVVVRRRGNQTNTGSGVAGSANLGRDLVTR